MGTAGARRDPRAMTTTVAHLLAVLLATVGSVSLAPTPTPVTVAPQVPAAGVWPMEPVPAVVAGFRPPATRYAAGHRGVDLAGRAGQVVRAAAGGRVTYAGLLAGRGVVVVDHGPTRTTYEPVRATVGVGTVVGAGDKVGRLEAAGSHCAPAVCLHWGLVEGDAYLDPLTLVGAGPVRLLPLDGLPAGGAPRAATGALEAGPVAGRRAFDRLLRAVAPPREAAGPVVAATPPARPRPV